MAGMRLEGRSLRLCAFPAWVLGFSLLAAPTPNAESRADSTESFRVMTFNIRYGTADDGENDWLHRRGRLIAAIHAYGPDLLGTQECLAMQADDLRRAFPEYDFVGAGREDGASAGEMCAIFYRRERFVKLAEGHFWLSETPNTAGSVAWDAALTRMATWVQLQEKNDARTVVWVFNTHFDHLGEVARLRSARLLADSLAAKTGFRRAILMGDFNAPADSVAARLVSDGITPYAVLTRGLADSERLVDAYRALHPASDEEATYHGFTGETRGERVDWILSTTDLVPIDARIVRDTIEGRYPSDHFPVAAVLTVRADRSP